MTMTNQIAVNTETRTMNTYDRMIRRGYSPAEARAALRRIEQIDRDNEAWEAEQNAKQSKPSALSDDQVSIVLEVARTGVATGWICLSDDAHFGAEPLGDAVEWWIYKDEVGYLASGRFKDGRWCDSGT